MNNLKRRIYQYAAGSTLLGLFLIIISLFIPPDYKIYSSFMFNLGSVLVGAGTVGLIFDYVAKEDLIERVSGRVDHINKMDLEEFYENRNDLPGLPETLKDCEEAWCAWFTGGYMALTGKINGFKGIKTRLILTKPDSSSLDHFKIILKNENKEDWNREIKLCTKKDELTKFGYGNKYNASRTLDFPELFLPIKTVILFNFKGFLHSFIPLNSLISIALSRLHFLIAPPLVS